MPNSLVPGLIMIGLLASTTGAQTLTIDHQPVGCVTVGKFPRLEVRLAPAEEVATARVVFQGQTADWYSVAMKAEGPVFAGVLPKPKKELKSFRYYIDVTGKALGTNRTAEFTASVVDSASACRGKLMAGAVGTASVILQGPAGVAALPAGFASSGVVAGTATGSTAAAGAGASAAGAGGGIGATALVIGGVVVAGGAAAAVVASKGEDDGSGSTGSNNPGATTSYTISFLPLPGINVSACGPNLTTFNVQGFEADSSGAFDTVWSPQTPVLRAAGRITSSAFQATLNCTNGARSGTMSATGSGGTYNGTFEFGPSQGQIVITRR